MKLNKKGFTLIELMVVMAIIAVLATLIIGAVQLARRTATETTHRTNGKTIQTALEGAFAKNRKYCSTTSESGQLPCPSADKDSPATYGFTEAAVDTYLGVKLGQANSDGTCTVAGGDNGGGRILVYPGGYTITPQNFDCSAPLTQDVLTMP